ncbi:hypothetical protein NST66_27660 [Priestia sp. FSL W8-0524]|uniref:hypothetical protein n=1 Tax=Priestia sp. FSL W8-0524 TaxID=2954625 RepID=UPI0030F4E1DE
MNSASRFKMQIYSPIWGQNDLYQFIKTKDGWKFENYRCKGEVDRGGNPLFYKALTSESISYPDYVEGYISIAWENVDTLNKEQVQNIFDELSEWISASENNLY